jgi:hypothetical protein
MYVFSCTFCHAKAACVTSTRRLHIHVRAKLGSVLLADESSLKYTYTYIHKYILHIYMHVALLPFLAAAWTPTLLGLMSRPHRQGSSPFRRAPSKRPFSMSVLQITCSVCMCTHVHVFSSHAYTFIAQRNCTCMQRSQHRACICTESE